MTAPEPKVGDIVVDAPVVGNVAALYRVVEAAEPTGPEFTIRFTSAGGDTGTLRTRARSLEDAEARARVIADHSQWYRGIALTYQVSAVTA